MLRGRDRRKGEIHRNEYWYRCQEHPDSRLTHPQSCPTSGVHLKVLHRAPLGHRHVTPARQRLTGQEQVADALPPVLVVLPQRNSGPGRQRWPSLGQQLGRGLVEADHRPSGVIGFGVEVQQVLHVGHELRAHLGNAPFPLLPGLESVILRRLRTPSWDMEDANFNSTTLPARRRRVQWSCPAGGGRRPGRSGGPPGRPASGAGWPGDGPSEPRPTLLR